jgi:hypothetical protein
MPRDVPDNDDTEFWDKVKALAAELKTDGCTGVADIRVECCWRHDIAYFTGKDIDGEPITKEEADTLFRLCIQKRSKLGKYSPMSWIRWLGVKYLGTGTWGKTKSKLL